jgi:hypothetical protein
MGTELHGDFFSIENAMKQAVQIEIRSGDALKNTDCFDHQGDLLPGVWIYVLDKHGIWRTPSHEAPNSLYQWELAKIIQSMPEASISYTYNSHHATEDYQS